MGKERQNCWEFLNCGRESGGSRVSELGICPAATDHSFDGINSGKNAGRICRAVAGTFCGARVQGSFAEKRGSCIDCDFFKKVQEEVGTGEFPAKCLGFLFDGEKSPLLKGMTYRHIKAGEKVITQGEAAKEAFIIQRGSCLVLVENEGKLYPVGHIGAKEISWES